MFERFLAKSSAIALGLAIFVLAGPQSLEAQYSFSYNFTSGPSTQQTSGFYNGANISPWVFNSVADDGTTAINAQMRYRDPDGLPPVQGPNPTGENTGVTIRSRVTGAGGGNGTMIYNGSTSGTNAVPFVMDLSAVGSTFTMTMGYAPNPAITGFADEPPPSFDIGSQLMKMGMVTISGTNQPATLGINDSLFIDYRETTSVQGQFGSTTGYYEVRTLNSGTSPATGVTQLSPGTVTLQAGNSATNYNFYVYDTTFTNAGYDSGGEALFNVVTTVQAYSVNRTDNSTSLLGSSATYSVNNVSTDLNATELGSMFVAMGYRYPNTSQVSVTGTTYDYFQTNITIVPEPAAIGLVGLSVLALLPRRRAGRTKSAS